MKIVKLILYRLFIIQYKVTRAVTVKAETQLITRRRTHLHGFVVNDYDGIEYRIITKL